MLSLSTLSLTSQQGAGLPVIITATTAPVLASMSNGDSLADAYTAGVYASTEGTIASAVETYTINGSSASSATALTEWQLGAVSILVTDSVGNTRTFSLSQRVPYDAPTAAGGLADQSFTEDTGDQTYDVSGDFTGTSLTYAITTGPGSIDGSGVITFDTDALAVQAATSIVVTATTPDNQSVTSGFALTITDPAAAVWVITGSTITNHPVAPTTPSVSGTVIS